VENEAAMVRAVSPCRAISSTNVSTCLEVQVPLSSARIFRSVAFR
jgi:hypothetical protein